MGKLDREQEGRRRGEVDQILLLTSLMNETQTNLKRFEINFGIIYRRKY